MAVGKYTKKNLVKCKRLKYFYDIGNISCIVDYVLGLCVFPLSKRYRVNLDRVEYPRKIYIQRQKRPAARRELLN